MSIWITAGTVSVTNGSATVTGSGTSWDGTVRAGWAFIDANGAFYEIQSVDSDTEITLAKNYGGTTDAIMDYQILPTQGLTYQLANQFQAAASEMFTVIETYRTAKRFYGSQATMLADNTSYGGTYIEGDIFWAAGIPYQVAASDATDHDETTAGGIKLYSSFAGSGSVGVPVFGPGFTGGTYNPSTGIVTFTSDDGLGFSTGDLRGVGEQGDSAYQVWLDQGNVGTENDFFDDLSNGAVLAAQAAQAAAEAAQAAAESAETGAQTAETNAGTSETNAASSAASAASDAALAQDWATEVEDTEVTPGLYSALHHAAKAAASAALAAASETSASGDATLAQTYRDQAQAALTSVETIFDNFDDRFLGTKASDPTVDNDGDPLVAGAVYYNSTDDEVRFYNGATWDSPEAQAATSASQAAASASAAATSETNAGNSETAAAGHASTALGHANDADADRIAADTARIAAETAETNAETAQAAAEAARDVAEDWAEEAEDTEVTTGKYSALHHAAKALAAQTAAEAAQALAEAAQAGAETAETDAQTAQGLAETAQTAAQAAQVAAETARTQAQAAQAAAETAETNAETAETGAETAEAAAVVAQGAAEAAQSAAETAETNAETAQALAESARDTAQEWAEKAEDVEVTTGQYSALHHALKAAASATAAAGHVTTALGHANTAETHKVDAETAKTAAETAETNAAASEAVVITRLLGVHANDSAANTFATNNSITLAGGELYFNSTDDKLRLYDGSAWTDAVLDAGGFLAGSNNLSDVDNVATARSNLGLGSAALDDTGDFATAAQGANADTAHGWGDHAVEGYITGYTVTEGDVTAHEAALTITESQISDLGTYLTEVAFADLVAGMVITSGESFVDVDNQVMTAAAINDLIESKSYAPGAHTHVIADVTDFTDNSGNWDTAYGWGDHAGLYASAAQGATADAALPAASYTAADVLSKLLTVDGTGTGLDADLLDGNEASAFVLATEKGSANGVATLDGSGKLDPSQIPGGLDNFEEYADLASFPGTGASDIIYVAQDTNYLYRWSGSAYIQVGGGGGGVNAVELTHTNGVVAMDVSLGTHFRFDTDVYTGADPNVPIIEHDTSFTSGTNNLPAGLQEDDDVFLYITNDSTTVVTIDDPLDWTQVAATTHNGRTISIYHKRMGAVPDTTFSCNTSSEDGFIAVYRGLKLLGSAITEPDHAADWDTPDVELVAGAHLDPFTLTADFVDGQSTYRTSMFKFEDVVVGSDPEGLIIQMGDEAANDWGLTLGFGTTSHDLHVVFGYSSNTTPSTITLLDTVAGSTFHSKTLDFYVSVQAYPQAEVRMAVFEGATLIYSNVWHLNDMADSPFGRWAENLTEVLVGGTQSSGRQPAQVLQNDGFSTDDPNVGLTLGKTYFWNYQVPWPEFWGVADTPVAKWNHVEVNFNYGVYTGMFPNYAEPVTVDPFYAVFHSFYSDGSNPDHIITFLEQDADGDWDTNFDNIGTGQSTHNVILHHSDGRVTDGLYPADSSLQHNAPYISTHFGTIGLELQSLQPAETGYRNFTFNLSNLPDITEPATLEINVRDTGGNITITGLTGWIGEAPKWNKTGVYSILLFPSDDAIYGMHIASAEEFIERFQPNTVEHASGTVTVDLNEANMHTFEADVYSAGTPEFVGYAAGANFNYADSVPVAQAQPGDIALCFVSMGSSIPDPGADPETDDGHPTNYPDWERLDAGGNGTFHVVGRVLTADDINDRSADIRGFSGNYFEQITMLFRSASWPPESMSFDGPSAPAPLEGQDVAKVTTDARAYQYFMVQDSTEDVLVLLDENDFDFDDYTMAVFENKERGGFSGELIHMLLEEDASSPTRSTGTSNTGTDNNATALSGSNTKNRAAFALAPGAASGTLAYTINFSNKPVGEYAHGYLFLEVKDAAQSFNFGVVEWLNDNEPTFDIPGLYTLEYWVSSTETRLLYHKTALGGLPYASEAQGTNADTAFGWGDHSLAGYLTSVSEAAVTAHQAALSITKSQVSDFSESDYQPALAEGDFADGDKTKLDGIEAGATADQTGAQIKAAYEGEADTNAFTDADHAKLDGIETGADVTDTGNVTAAGALMDSEVTNLAAVKAFDPADYATAAQGTSADTAFSWGDHGLVGYLTSYTVTQGDVTAHEAALTILEAQISDLGNYQVILSEGAFVNGDKSKLDGIEAGATGDQSGAEIVSAIDTELGGTTWQSGGGGGGGLDFSNVVTSATTMAAGNGYLADSSGGAFTLTLPSAPGAGDRVVIADATGDWAANNVTIGRNGETIEGATENLVLDVGDLIVTMLYTGSDWQVFAEARSYDEDSGDMMKSVYDTNNDGVVDEAASLTGFTDNSANWNTAFGWGDHGAEGYLTAVAWGDVTGKPSFATVATSGAYSDLTGAPAIPVVSDAAYDESTWDGNTDAPSKNAVRDAIENLDTGGVSGSTIYGLSMIL